MRRRSRNRNGLRKICHVHLLPLLSGPQNWTLGFFDQLPRERYELHVVVASEGDFCRELRARDVRVHVFPSLVREISPVRDVWALLALIRFFRHERFDLVHTHSSKPGFLGRVAARLAGVPAVIHHAHGLIFHDLSTRLEWGLYSTLERLAARMCDAVIFVNDEDRIGAEQRRVVPSAKACTIYNGVDLSRFSPSERERLRLKTRADLGLDASRSVIAFVGRLEPPKSPLELVAALAELCSRAPALDPVMIVAGDGSLREPLTRAVSGAALDARVRLLGWRRDVPAILAAADVFYMPSLVEGLPLNLIEAACMGVPAIASDSKGCREVVVDGETGLLVPPGDASAAARALEEVLGSPERARRLGEAAARRGRELYDVRAMALAVERVYDELLG